MHSCWFILNFAETIRQIGRENFQVFQFMYIISCDYMEKGSIDWCLGVQEIRSYAYHSAGVERGVELIWVGRVWGSDNFNLSAAKQCVMSPLFLVEVHRLDQYSQRRERGGGVRRGDGLASF